MWSRLLYPSRESGPPPINDDERYEAQWWNAIDQQQQWAHGMPEYTSVHLHGDIANMQFLSLVLVRGLHYAANSSGDFADPGSFDITVRSGEFEIRRPL